VQTEHAGSFPSPGHAARWGGTDGWAPGPTWTRAAGHLSLHLGQGRVRLLAATRVDRQDAVALGAEVGRDDVGGLGAETGRAQGSFQFRKMDASAGWLSHGLALSRLGTAVNPSQRISEGHSCQSLGTEFSMTWSRLLPNSFARGPG
jgi:hypothetical protein